ncbi:MAG TPA: hypothetical protein PK793_06500, partial [Syntrophales bacterium]|nr:hypothetical protein [Syntrophales bacterium]
MDKSKSIFDNIGALIPGYRGYAEREGRRHCDRIVRESVAQALAACEKAVHIRIVSGVKQQHKETLYGWEETRKRLNTLSTNIKYAAYGASSFFSDSQIRKEELEMIIVDDFDLLEEAQTLRRNINKMNKADIDSALTDLEDRL